MRPVAYFLLAFLCVGLVTCKTKAPSPVAISPIPPPGASPWDLPLPYLGATVTAAKFMINASLVSKYDSDTERDRIVVDIQGQGPVLWSISRFNRGDLSPRIQPRRPFAQSNLGIPGDPKEGFRTSDFKHFSTQAWRPSVDRGVLLASVAQNGQEWNDGTPRFYGTVACVMESEGYGYSMSDGTFGADNPNLDITIGKAGRMDEANIDVAVAWFPYDQGWMGGYLDQPSQELYMTPLWSGEGAHSPLLDADAGKVIRWGKRGATLQLSGVKPEKDGMLFVTSTDPSKENNDVNCVGIYTKHHHPGWRIQMREDSSPDPSQLTKPTQFMFAFVYIPFTAGGLVGGNIDGFSGKTISGRGPYVVNRRGVGEYEIRIAGPHEAEWEDDTKTEQDGILLLQITGRDDSNHHYAKHAFLSYNYTQQGTLFVQCRELVVDGMGNEDFPLTDSDFSFVWIDFNKPLTPTYKDFSGYFQVKTGGVGFWGGFVAALLLILLSGGAAYGGFVFVSQRTAQSGFINFADSAEREQLGSDLLHSDFRFSD